MPRTIGQAVGFLLGFGFALWLSPFGGGFVNAESSDPSREVAELEDLLHRAVNAERARHHLVPLQRRPELDGVARSHSRDMARRGFLDHTTPEGLDPVDRIRTAAAPGFSLAAENLGITDRADPNREILQGWLASPVHRRNLLAPPFNATGIGISRAPDGSLLYTQVYLTYPR